MSTDQFQVMFGERRWNLMFEHRGDMEELRVLLRVFQGAPAGSCEGEEMWMSVVDVNG